MMRNGALSLENAVLPALKLTALNLGLGSDLTKVLLLYYNTKKWFVLY